MTTKHYKFFVQWIADNHIDINSVNYLIEYFKSDNPKFDVDIFADKLLEAWNRRDGVE